MNDTVAVIRELLPRPVVLYGTGDGADKIIALLEKNGIPISGIFASDGFVRNRSFHSLPVMSYSEMKEKFENPVILLCFGTHLSDVILRVVEMATDNTLLVPDVPVCGDSVFDSGFYSAHKDEISATRELFYDESSKMIYDSVIEAKMTGDLSSILYADKISCATRYPLHGKYTAYVDFGAYRGETVIETLGKFKGIEKVSAFEPSVKNFARLDALKEKYPDVDFQFINGAASDKNGLFTMTDGGGRGSSLEKECAPSAQSGARIKECREVKADSVLMYGGERLLLKYDVEGWEEKALYGSLGLIKDNKTDIALSVYHRSEDIFRLPAVLHSILPEHELYLRKSECLPCWEITVYACMHN